MGIGLSWVLLGIYWVLLGIYWVRLGSLGSDWVRPI